MKKIDFFPRIRFHIDKLKSRHYKYNTEQIKKMGFFSQYGQDIILSKFFKNPNGFFVDIGAHNGITFNNTYYFEKNLNWKGIAFEPNPDVYEKLKYTRKCECINACISEKSGDSEFLQIKGYPEMLSGIQSKYKKNHIKRINREIKRHGGEIKKIRMKCYTLNEILDGRNIKNIEILSIDTEGGEFEIIKSIDFSNINIESVCIENNYSDYRIWEKLLNEGYYLFASTGKDEIYIKKDIKNTSNY